MNNDIELNKAKQYVRDLTSGSLLIAESRLIAETLLSGLPEFEWKRLFIDENILKKNPGIPLSVMPNPSEEDWNH